MSACAKSRLSPAEPGHGGRNRRRQRHAGAAALASDDALTDEDVAAIRRRLSRFDAASGTGPWTQRYLELVCDNEAVRAPDLAAREGLDVPWFKRRVRQLKGLGLTISLDVGYRISPRGRAFLAASSAWSG